MFKAIVAVARTMFSGQLLITHDTEAIKSDSFDISVTSGVDLAASNISQVLARPGGDSKGYLCEDQMAV
ncbi:Hypp7511 [Branchiostoma lanceolatum]|uniref:Hypp7511 protein n=1 Tax=Branchiostoma lanceolatum TaxID=7740 RepID=A0A8J9Z0Z3_BRALA|nr:Hypp7511 [Branchiostoma lanceolatum]